MQVPILLDKIEFCYHFFMSVSVLFLYTPLTRFTCSKVRLQGWLMCFKNWCTLPRKKKLPGCTESNNEDTEKLHTVLENVLKTLSDCSNNSEHRNSPVFQSQLLFLASRCVAGLVCRNEKVSSGSSVDARTFAGCRYLEHHLLPEVLLQLVGLAAEFHVLLGPHALNETDVTRFLLSDVT